MRQALVYRGEDSYWIAGCPNLPGCVSRGRTKEEAISNIREAIEGYVAALEKDHLPIPPEKVRCPDRGMSTLPRISGRECIKTFSKIGFMLRRQHGHMILRRFESFAQFVVPDRKELDRGNASSHHSSSEHFS